MPLYNPELARYAVETDKRIFVILGKMLRQRDRAHTLDVEQEAHLYIPHVSTEEALRRDAWAKTLIRRRPFYFLDVRGLGESLPYEEHSFFNGYGMDYMLHSVHRLFGESYIGHRVHDVLSVIELLASEGARHIYLYGRGQGALLALFASLLDTRVRQVTLRNAPHSFQDWARTPVVTWPNANIIPGVLKEFDIPDCLQALGSRVKELEPWGPNMAPVRSTRQQSGARPRHTTIKER